MNTTAFKEKSKLQLARQKVLCHYISRAQQEDTCISFFYRRIRGGKKLNSKPRNLLPVPDPKKDEYT